MATGTNTWGTKTWVHNDDRNQRQEPVAGKQWGSYKGKAQGWHKGNGKGGTAAAWPFQRARFQLPNKGNGKTEDGKKGKGKGETPCAWSNNEVPRRSIPRDAPERTPSPPGTDPERTPTVPARNRPRASRAGGSHAASPGTDLTHATYEAMRKDLEGIAEGAMEDEEIADPAIEAANAQGTRGTARAEAQALCAVANARAPYAVAIRAGESPPTMMLGAGIDRLSGLSREVPRARGGWPHPYTQVGPDLVYSQGAGDPPPPIGPFPPWDLLGEETSARASVVEDPDQSTCAVTSVQENVATRAIDGATDHTPPPSSTAGAASSSAEGPAASSNQTASTQYNRT